MFIVRDITANNPILGKYIQYPQMLRFEVRDIRPVKRHSVANFSVLHGIDKRITPLRDTPPGKVVRL